jgi:hypothetical protein
LAADYQAVLAACDQAGDPDSEKAFQDTLAALKGEIEVKLDNCAAVLETMQAEADALQHEEQRLKARRAAIESNQSRLKNYMQEQMEACNIEKSKGARFTVLVQLNPPKVVIDDEDLILDSRFWRQKIELAKDVLGAALRAGETIEGAHLTRERSLRVR